ncbi:hypothetical protein ACUXZJ_09850 [Flavobacterium sp. TN-1]
MKTKMLFWWLITVLLISCKSDRIEGTYYFVDTKSKDFFELGRDMACSSVGRFEFKNGKCYINVMGVEKRLDYDIENNVIYLKNYNGGSGETGLTIVDDNTISFMGCMFKKNEDVVNENSNKIEEAKEELKNSNIDGEEKSKIINPKKVIKGSVEVYTYYSNRKIDDIKEELKKFGVKFFKSESFGYIEENGSSCYSVQLEQMNNKVKITYGYECDSL